MVPTSWAENVRLAGETLAMGATPVPVRLMLCGLSPALSLSVTAAVRAPVAPGVKVTEIVQLAPAASVPVALLAGIQVLVCAKSPLFAPLMLMLFRLSGALPLLVRVVL